MVAMHQEKKRTRELYKTLTKRSKELKEKPEILIPLEEAG